MLRSVRRGPGNPEPVMPVPPVRGRRRLTGPAPTLRPSRTSRTSAPSPSGRKPSAAGACCSSTTWPPAGAVARWWTSRSAQDWAPWSGPNSPSPPPSTPLVPPPEPSDEPRTGHGRTARRAGSSPRPTLLPSRYLDPTHGHRAAFRARRLRSGPRTAPPAPMAATPGWPTAAHGVLPHGCTFRPPASSNANAKPTQTRALRTP